MSNCIGEGCTDRSHVGEPRVVQTATEHVCPATPEDIAADQRAKHRAFGPSRNGRIHHRARHENGRRKAKRRIQKASRRGNR